MLCEPYGHELLRCNIWHVRGRDRDLLVDTGVGVAVLNEAATDLFDASILAVATHAHMDHSGGRHEFEQRAIHNLATHTLEATTATIVLEEADVIDLGDRAFEVMHLPGHSPGSIGLFDAKSRLLFSGDAAYDGPLLDELEGSDVDDYLATMTRLIDLDVEVVHGGHGPSMDRTRFREIVQQYLDRRGGS